MFEGIKHILLEMFLLWKRDKYKNSNCVPGIPYILQASMNLE